MFISYISANHAKLLNSENYISGGRLVKDNLQSLSLSMECMVM